jgi:CHAT domain
MPLEQKLPLPFIDKFPLHVQIRVFANGNSYMADMNANWSNWQRFHIGIKPNDLEEINFELQQAIENVSLNFKKDSIRTDALARLAQKGNFAFKRIFSEGAPREVVKKLLEVGATIQFSSEDFFIPWELLYDGPLGAQVDPSYFWGMKHIISRALIREARPGDLGSPIIQSACPHVGLITCSDLEYVVAEEVPALQDLHRQSRILLSSLRPLDAAQRDAELEYLGHFLSDEELQIVHLACHAFKEKTLSQSYLRISDKFRVSIEDFLVREFEIKQKPLVILNACLTGTMSPLYTSNWAALFWERGARGVLATEFHVPDWFAAAFIGQLYSHLLVGKPIGESLLAMRHYFWVKQNNPLGLAYALYSSPAIRVVNPNQERETERLDAPAILS